jgi:hypothetical protein
MNAGSVGAIVGVAFGCAWGIAGATALPAPWRAWVVGLSIGISAALVVALAVLPARRKAGTFRGREYGVIVALEAVGIVMAVRILEHFSLSQFLLPVIGFIVGLHFIGLWKATDLSLFLWIAGALCIVCVVAVFLPDLTENGGINVRRVVAGLGCALVLWGAGLVTLF